MKNSIVRFLLVGLHVHLTTCLPQHVLADTDESLSNRPQQQLSITINIAQPPFPFHDASMKTCVTEEYGCTESYCWMKVSFILPPTGKILIFRNADTFVSVLMLEIGAGDWMRRVILLGVRQLPIVLQRPLLVRCEGVMGVLILTMFDELLSHTHLTYS
jgi:hypothetical protein